MYRILDKRNRPLEFINHKGRDHLKNVYRFNAKNPLEFETVAAAQAFLNDKIGQCLYWANKNAYPKHLWRSIRSTHWSLRIVASDEPVPAKPTAPKVFVVVRGGNVEAIYAAPGSEYLIIDHDNGKVDDIARSLNESYQKILDSEINNGVVKQIDEAGWEHCKVLPCR